MAIAKNLGRTIILVVSAALSSCAPSSIPSGASVHWGVDNGSYWTWTQTVKHGCAAWMAEESYATVQLLVNGRCDGKPWIDRRAGRGLSYLSFEDRLIFQGYWPWTEDDHVERMVFDRRGTLKSVRPCGYSLSATQISGVNIVAHEAYNQAQTDAEKRVLARVMQRLAVVGNKALASGQEGCKDLPANQGSPAVRDVWKNG